MKIALMLIVVLAMLASALWFFGPREGVDGPMTFDIQQLGDDLDVYLARREADVPDLRPGAEKRIVWANPGTKAQTEWSIVYVHGFSATSEEIRPVPDRVAEALGANLVFTRLKGHGRDGPAMAEARVSDWTSDIVEAMAIGRKVGKKIILISTSTGGTLSTLAALDGRANGNLTGMVMVSPNFGVQAASTEILNMPWGRSLLPMIVGEERGFEPRSEGHAQWWTTTYPTEALVPMAAAMKAAAELPHQAIRTPLLMFYSPDDTVVKPEEALKVADAWGGPVTRVALELGPGDDPGRHVIAGDIMSPGQTDRVVQEILDWVAGL